MKTTLFMRQPFFVTGYKVTEENMHDIAKWCRGHVINDDENPFIRVPVHRPANLRQTEAYIGTWVLLSRHGDNIRSFKVYTEEFLTKNFIVMDDALLSTLGDIKDDVAVSTHKNEPHTHNENARTLPNNERPSIVKPVNFRPAAG